MPDDALNPADFDPAVVDKTLKANSFVGKNGGKLGCATTVCGILKSQGINIPETANAAQLENILPKYGFQRVPLNESEVVIGKGTGPSGRHAMYHTGNGITIEDPGGKRGNSIQYGHLPTNDPTATGWKYVGKSSNSNSGESLNPSDFDPGEINKAILAHSNNPPPSSTQKKAKPPALAANVFNQDAQLDAKNPIPNSKASVPKNSSGNGGVPTHPSVGWKVLDYFGMEGRKGGGKKDVEGIAKYVKGLPSDVNVIGQNLPEFTGGTPAQINAQQNTNPADEKLTLDKSLIQKYNKITPAQRAAAKNKVDRLSEAYSNILGLTPAAIGTPGTILDNIGKKVLQGQTLDKNLNPKFNPTPVKNYLKALPTGVAQYSLQHLGPTALALGAAGFGPKLLPRIAAGITNKMFPAGKLHELPESLPGPGGTYENPAEMATMSGPKYYEANAPQGAKQFGAGIAASAANSANKGNGLNPDDFAPEELDKAISSAQKPGEAVQKKGIYNSQTLSTAIQKHFKNVTPEQADAAAKLADARAQTWAKHNGKTPDEWYQNHIAKVTTTKPSQIEGNAILGQDSENTDPLINSFNEVTKTSKEGLSNLNTSVGYFLTPKGVFKQLPSGMNNHALVAEKILNNAGVNLNTTSRDLMLDHVLENTGVIRVRRANSGYGVEIRGPVTSAQENALQELASKPEAKNGTYSIVIPGRKQAYGNFQDLFDDPQFKQLRTNKKPLFQNSEPGNTAPAFYSQSEKVINQKMGGKQKADDLGKMLQANGVKPDEMKWSGLDDFINQNKGQVVSKRQVLDHLKNNQVQVQEVEKKHVGPNDYRIGMTNNTKYDQFQMPGGENYRELLLTLPEPKMDEYGMYPEGSQNTYKSSHWSEPNVLAHVRFNDRTGPNGEKILHLEELQSDWGQEGRKKGFKGEDKDSTELTSKEQEEMHSLVNIPFRDRTEVQSERLHELTMRNINSIGESSKVPSAPFVGKTESWMGLSLKRMLRYAAENGYNKISWTPGEEQAARYDLSKQVSKVTYAPNDKTLTAFDHSGRSVINESNIGLDKLSDYIGKEAAEKIINNPTSIEKDNYGGVQHTLGGLDLKVGGEGMKGFYNKIIPDFLNKYAKKWGAQVGKTEISLPNKADQKFGPTYENDYSEGNKASVPSIDITPQMKKSLMEEGQPLFQKQPEQGGKIPPKAAVSFLKDGRAVIHAIENPDISSVLHEMGHIFRRDLEGNDLNSVEKWVGLKPGEEWQTAHEEKFARGFERYLRDGHAPNSNLADIFGKFRTWLTNIYKTLKGSSININLSPEVKQAFDNLLKDYKEKPTGKMAKHKPEIAGENINLDRLLLTREEKDQFKGLVENIDAGEHRDWDKVEQAAKMLKITPKYLDSIKPGVAPTGVNGDVWGVALRQKMTGEQKKLSKMYEEQNNANPANKEILDKAVADQENLVKKIAQHDSEFARRTGQSLSAFNIKAEPMQIAAENAAEKAKALKELQKLNAKASASINKPTSPGIGTTPVNKRDFSEISKNKVFSEDEMKDAMTRLKGQVSPSGEKLYQESEKKYYQSNSPYIDAFDPRYGTVNDPLFIKAKALLDSGKGVTGIQRELHIGYTRAYKFKEIVDKSSKQTASPAPPTPPSGKKVNSVAKGDLPLFVKVGGYYLENGAKTAADWQKKMSADFPNLSESALQQVWTNVLAEKNNRVAAKTKKAAAQKLFVDELATGMTRNGATKFINEIVDQHPDILDKLINKKPLTQSEAQTVEAAYTKHSPQRLSQPPSQGAMRQVKDIVSFIKQGDDLSRAIMKKLGKVNAQEFNKRVGTNPDLANAVIKLRAGQDLTDSEKRVMAQTLDDLKRAKKAKNQSPVSKQLSQIVRDNQAGRLGFSDAKDAVDDILSRALKDDPAKLIAATKAVAAVKPGDIHDLANVYNKHYPSTLSAKYRTYVQASLLSGPKTLSAIAIGHLISSAFEHAAVLPLAAAVDAARAKAGIFGKERSVANPSASRFMAGLSKGIKSIPEGFQYLREGGTSMQLRGMYPGYRVDMLHGKRLHAEPIGHNKLTAPARIPSRTHGAIFHVIGQGLEEYGRREAAELKAKRVGITPAEKKDWKKYYDDADVKDAGLAHRLEQLYQNENKTATALKAAGKAGGPIGEMLLGAEAPFTTTPANIAGRGIEYSGTGIPYGLAKVISRARKENKGKTPLSPEEGQAANRGIALSIARGTAGLGPVAAGYALTKSGVLNPPSQKKHELGSVNMGKYKLDASRLQPASNPFMYGGEFAKDKEHDYIAPLEDNPFMHITEQLQALRDKGLPGFFGNLAGIHIPTLLAQAASATDPSGKLRKKDRFIDYPMNRVPGLREKLPVGDYPQSTNIKSTGPLSLLSPVNISPQEGGSGSRGRSKRGGRSRRRR